MGHWAERKYRSPGCSPAPLASCNTALKLPHLCWQERAGLGALEGLSRIRISPAAMATSFNGEGTTPLLCSSCEVLIRNCMRNFHAVKMQKRRRLTKDTRTKQLPASSSPGTCSANPLLSQPPTNATLSFVNEVTATTTATSPSFPTTLCSQFLLTAYPENTSLPHSHCSALSYHCFPSQNALQFEHLWLLTTSCCSVVRFYFLLQQADLLLKVTVQVSTS